MSPYTTPKAPSMSVPSACLVRSGWLASGSMLLEGGFGGQSSVAERCLAAEDNSTPGRVALLSGLRYSA